MNLLLLCIVPAALAAQKTVTFAGINGVWSSASTKFSLGAQTSGTGDAIIDYTTFLDSEAYRGVTQDNSVETKALTLDDGDTTRALINSDGFCSFDASNDNYVFQDQSSTFLLSNYDFIGAVVRNTGPNAVTGCGDVQMVADGAPQVSSSSGCNAVFLFAMYRTGTNTLKTHVKLWDGTIKSFSAMDGKHQSDKLGERTCVATSSSNTLEIITVDSSVSVTDATTFSSAAASSIHPVTTATLKMGEISAVAIVGPDTPTDGYSAEVVCANCGSTSVPSCAAYTFSTGTVAGDESGASSGCTSGTALAAGTSCTVKCDKDYVARAENPDSPYSMYDIIVNTATISCGINSAAGDAPSGTLTCDPFSGHGVPAGTVTGVSSATADGYSPDSYVEQFHDIPRLEGDNEFEMQAQPDEDDPTPYLKGVILMVVPWGVVAILVLLVSVTFFCCCKHTSGIQLWRAVPAILVICGCVVGWAGNGEFDKGIKDVSDSLGSIHGRLLRGEDYVTQMKGLTTTMDDHCTYISSSCPYLAQYTSGVSDNLAEAKVQLDKYTDASDGVPEKVDDVKGYIDDNLDAVNQAMVGFFVVIGFFAIFGMVLFLRTRCLTNAGVDVNEHHCCVTCSRKILCILLTFIMFLTFVCAGILMGVAALSSDFCMKPSANIIEELDVSQHQERTKIVMYYTGNVCGDLSAKDNLDVFGNKMTSTKTQLSQAQAQIPQLKSALNNDGCYGNGTAAPTATVDAVSAKIDELSADLGTTQSIVTNVENEVECSEIFSDYKKFVEDGLCTGVARSSIMIFVALMLISVFIFFHQAFMPVESGFDKETQLQQRERQQYVQPEPVPMGNVAIQRV